MTKSKTLLLVCSLLFLSNAFASGKGEVMVLDQEDTGSTYSFSSHTTDYESLSPKEKYKSNLRNYSQNKALSLERMKTLATTYNYEDAQLYLAECYRTGVFGKSNKDKAIDMNILALDQNNSFQAAENLAGIYWSKGDFEKSKEYCDRAKILAYRQNKSLDFINTLLSNMSEE